MNHIHVVFFLFTLMCSCVGTAQQYLYQTEEFERIAIDFSGRIQTSSIPMMDVVLFKSQKLLRDKAIQDDLEMTAEQVRKMDEFFRELDDKRREFAKKFGQKQLTNSEQRELSDYRDSIYKKLDSILLQHQIEGLDSILLFIDMQKEGISKVIAHRCNHNGVPQQTSANDLAIVAKQQSKMVTEKCHSITQKAIEDLFEELSTEQRDAIEQLVGQEFLESMSPALLILDIRDALEREYVAKNTSTVDFFRRIGGFQQTGSGIWRRFDRQGLPDELAKLELVMAIGHDVENFSELSLSPRQVDELESAIDDYLTADRKATADFHPLFRDALPAEIDSLRKEYRQINSDIRSELIVAFERTISPSQLRGLDKRLTRLSILSNGLFSELVANEKFRQEAGVSESDLKALKKQLPKIGSELEKKLDSIFQDAVATMVENENAVIKRELNDAIAARPKFAILTPNIFK